MSHTNFRNPNLELQLQELASPIETWTPPLRFDLANSEACQEVNEMIERKKIRRVVDRIGDIASDMFELTYPNKKEDEASRREYVTQIEEQGIGYGNWFYFDWSGVLVRYQEVGAHRSSRTFRNCDVIEQAEQATLFDKKVATFGLSVGSNVHRQMMRAGIGGSSVIGDYDTISPSNLNRIEVGFTAVGQSKIDQVAIATSELDPYVEQTLFRAGYAAKRLEAMERKPDIIFEEVDDLNVKLAIRRFAAEHKIPVVMATDVDDTSLIDVERYDIENPEPFLGRLKDKQLEALQADKLSPEEKQKLMIKLVGLTAITPRLLRSAMHIGDTLAGLPQLGTTASMGGSLATVTAREILLQRHMPSGRYVHKPKRVLKLKSPDSVQDNLRVVRDFVTKSKSN